MGRGEKRGDSSGRGLCPSRGTSGQKAVQPKHKPEAAGLRGAGTARQLTGMTEELAAGTGARALLPPALRADASALPGVHAGESRPLAQAPPTPVPRAGSCLKTVGLPASFRPGRGHWSPATTTLGGGRDVRRACLAC